MHALSLTRIRLTIVAFAAAAAIAAVAGVPRIVDSGGGGPVPAAPTARTPAWFAPIAAYHGTALVTPEFDFASLYGAAPAWFAPIARYYHDNPAVTPGFDFASLYAGS